MSDCVPPWRSARLCRVGSGWEPGYSIMAWPPGWSAHPLPPPKTVQYDLLKGASSRPRGEIEPLPGGGVRGAWQQRRLSTRLGLSGRLEVGFGARLCENAGTDGYRAIIE